MSDIPSTITRVTVVDARNRRVIETFADEWDIVIQDDGRTLKLFAKGDGEVAFAERNTSLGRELEEGYRQLAADPEYQAMSEARRRRRLH